MRDSPGRRGIIGRSLALAALASSAASRAGAGSLYLDGSGLGGGAASLRFESFQARRFRETIAQAHDFSCGSAAVATLLTFTYGTPTTEREVFVSMIEHGDAAAIRAYGFSLLDIKRYLVRRGLEAEGFRAPLAKLVEVRVPAIVLINTRNYNHFVVLTGVRDGRVLLSDPAVGARAMTIAAFEAAWNGAFFLILSDVERAQARFNDARSWTVVPTAPLALTRHVLDFASLAQPANRVAGGF